MNQYQYRKQLEPGVELLILIGLWVACFIAGSVITIPVWIIMTGKSILDMGKEMLNPANVGALKVMQVVSTIIIFFVPAVITARIVAANPFERLGFKGGLRWNRIITSCFIMLCALPLVAFLAEVNKAIPVTAALRKLFDSMESQYLAQVKLMATFKTPVDYVVALFVIALMPAVVEEVFFRGAMQQMMQRWLGIPWLAILVTAFIFSAVHFSWYGFFPRMVLGAVLGGLFYVTGNLWYSIIGHFANNALMVSVLYWQYTKYKKIDMEVGEQAPWWAGLLSLALVVGLFVLLRQFSATKVYPDSIASTSDTNTQS